MVTEKKKQTCQTPHVLTLTFILSFILDNYFIQAEQTLKWNNFLQYAFTWKALGAIPQTM